MNKNTQWFESEMFWKILGGLESLQGPYPLRDFLVDTDCDESNAKEVLYYLKNLGLEFKLEAKDGADWISPPDQLPKFSF